MEALIATFDSGDKSITFTQHPILGWRGEDPIVKDGGEILPLSEIDCEGSDAIAEILMVGEIPTLEQRVDMSERLFLRMMHYGVL